MQLKFEIYAYSIETMGPTRLNQNSSSYLKESITLLNFAEIIGAILIKRKFMDGQEGFQIYMNDKQKMVKERNKPNLSKCQSSENKQTPLGYA